MFGIALYKKWITDDGLLLLKKWATEGLTDEQIAIKMKVSSSTLYNWKNRFKEFAQVLEDSKERADSKVYNSLYKNATGFTYTEEVVIMKKEIIYENGRKVNETVAPEVVTVTKRKLPETTAQIFWLKNRAPELWRNEPNMVRLKEKEVQLKEEVVKTKNW